MTIRTLTIAGILAITASAGALAIYPSSAAAAGDGAVPPAGMAAAVALVAPSAAPNSCTPAELNAKVSACVNTVCVPHYDPTGIEFQSCVNACVEQAQAECHGG